VIAHLIGRIAVTLTRLAHRLGVHVYLSTSCLHGQHDYCQQHTGLSGAKTPARCKFCPDDGRCVCACHRPTA